MSGDAAGSQARACEYPPKSEKVSGRIMDDGCDPNIPFGCFHADACPLESDVCITRGCDSDTGCWEQERDCGESDLCNQFGCDLALPGGCWSIIGCDDEDPCTLDSCTETGCVNTPVDCDDNEICTDDSCDEDGNCRYDPAPGSCEDEVPPNACTDDICENGVCTLFDPFLPMFPFLPQL